MSYLRKMASRSVFRAAIAVGIPCLVAPACASTAPGADSNTHWIVCSTVPECPGGGAFECRGGHCVDVSGAGAGNPSSGGTCPPGITTDQPCDGRIAQCWTACAGGYRTQFECHAGKWVGTFGLFPCGADAGTEASYGGSPGGGAAGASGSPNGGAANGGRGG